MPPIWRDARGGADPRGAAPRLDFSPPVPLLSCGEVKPECKPSCPSCSSSGESPSLSSSSSALWTVSFETPCAGPAGFAACVAAAPSPPPALPDISMRRMRRSPPPRVKTVASPWRNLSIAAWAQSCLQPGCAYSYHTARFTAKGDRRPRDVPVLYSVRKPMAATEETSDFRRRRRRIHRKISKWKMIDYPNF